MKRTTIIDIAQSLGVTPSTVSRALAGNLRVRESTRKKVQEKALEMGYQPNVVAASLRRGRSDTVGMLVPRINRHFFSHVISAVEEVLNPAGFNLLICQSHERAELERQAIQVLLKNRVAGIIMSHAMETVDFDAVRRATEERVPVVQFDRVNAEVPGPRIVNDNFSGAYMAVKHLIRSGYSRIVHLTGSLSVNVYRERFRGYQYAMEEASLDFSDLIFEGAITRETAYEKVLHLLKNEKVDAFFCAGDHSSVGTMQAIHDCGLKMPDDIGVVGFANEPFAGFITPQLSTVEQNAYDMGHRAANALIRIINGSSLPGGDLEEVVPVRLLVRESSMRTPIVK
jgi:LacI family transcriptional regulator